jgi:hypothetical protein
VRLPGQDVSCVEVGLAKREVLVHLDGPGDDSRSALQTAPRRPPKLCLDNREGHDR